MANNQSIPGSRDTLTILGLYWDGDTLTRGVVCGVYPSQYNPRMVRVFLDLGIVWQGWMCGVYGHPTTVLGWLEYL